MPELILKEEVYQIVGAAMDVYYTLGRGFLEPVYQEALAIELCRRGIPFEAQKPLKIQYKGMEMKACEDLTGRDEGQILNYMKATRMRIGLLFNFGSQSRLEWKRYII